MKPLIAGLLIFCFGFTQHAADKGVYILTSGTATSLRGMSIPSDNVIWVSGSNGTVGKSVDAGQTWRWITVKDYEKNDFRDIHAFDSATAIIMAVGNPAYLLKTKDGGATWQQVYTKTLPNMFLDAMDFRNDKEGIVIGDPMAVGSAGRSFFFVARTNDGGETWQEDPLFKLPPATQNGEALFAASGTNIIMLNHPDFDYAFASGGKISNLFLVGREGKQSKMVQIPINQGIETTGTFSMASDRNKRFYCIGGDYKIAHSTYDNFYFTKDAGDKWASPSVAPPYGYRSCVQLIDEKKMIACGTNGVDICYDGGNNWKSIASEGFNVCMVAPNSKWVFLAGEKGKIGRAVY